MTEWKEVIEEGVVYYVNNALGNVMKVDENSYVALLPKVIRLGPFENLQQAQQALEINKAALENILTAFNHDIINLTKSIKR